LCYNIDIPFAAEVPNTNADTNTYNDYEAINTKLSQSGENISDNTVCNANANEGAFQLQQSPMLEWKVLLMLGTVKNEEDLVLFLETKLEGALLRIRIK